MASTIGEFFGYKSTDTSDIALTEAARQICPFLGSSCTKTLSDGEISGVCSLKQVSKQEATICCPVRLYANDYEILHILARRAFGQKLPLYSGRVAVDEARRQGGAVAVFGHGWGGELRLPKRGGKGSYFCDWVLARLDENGALKEFTAIEVQTIDTTGNYRGSRLALMTDRSTVKGKAGLNWENVSKRILPQITYKGRILEREQLCNTGLYFVCPSDVTAKIIERLGGEDNLPAYPPQRASITFFSYDYSPDVETADGEIRPLSIVGEYGTAISAVQEAFANTSLPDMNIYRDTLNRMLYD